MGVLTRKPPPRIYAYLCWLLQSQSLGPETLRRSWATTPNPSHGATKRWTIHWRDHYRKQNHSTWKTREQFHLLRFDLTKVTGAKFLTAVIALNHPSSSWLRLQPRRLLAIAWPISLAPCIQYHDSWPRIYHNFFLGWETLYTREYVSCDMCFC